MKRKISWLVLFLFIFVTFLYFIAHSTQGRWLKLRSDPGTVSSASTQHTFYKWQDENGAWHMSDTVPAGVTAHPVNVDTAANIIQSVPVRKENPETIAPPTTHSASALPGVPMTVNPADIPALLEQARGVQSLANDRAKQIDAVR